MFLADYFDDGYFDVEYWGSPWSVIDWTPVVEADTSWVGEGSTSNDWTPDAAVDTVWSVD